MIPLYIRITIDGLEDEISLSCKVRAEHWDSDLKQVLPGEPAWKAINKRISQAKTDIERHFYLIQAKHGMVTPAIVKESYQTPFSGQQIRNEKVENMQLSESVDQVIRDYLAHCEKRNRAYNIGRTPVPERLKLLECEKETIGECIQEQVRKANVLFDRLQPAFTGNHAGYNRCWKKISFHTIKQIVLLKIVK